MLDPVERKMLYAFLSVLFRHPDEQTVAAASGVREETFESLFPGLAAPAVPALRELQDGYRYLFLSTPAVAPPYGSAYLDKPDAIGYSARMVANLYASAGLEVENAPEPPDYLPSELEFLYYLTEGEEQSLARESGTPAHRWVASQADFFYNFFSPWIAPFCARIEADEKALPFYQWSARLLHHIVEMEQLRLKAR